MILRSQYICGIRFTLLFKYVSNYVEGKTYGFKLLSTITTIHCAQWNSVNIFLHLYQIMLNHSKIITTVLFPLYSTILHLSYYAINATLLVKIVFCLILYPCRSHSQNESPSNALCSLTYKLNFHILNFSVEILEYCGLISSLWRIINVCSVNPNFKFSSIIY
jgi:hypothetical protein